MGEITVTSEKVTMNGRVGFVATATDGISYTTTHRQNTREDAENVAVRLFKDGVRDGVINKPTESHHRDEMAGDGSSDTWATRVVPSTVGDNIKDFIIRFVLIVGLLAILALGLINFLVNLVPVQ